MALSRDDYYLGSCSHDSTVKFWNVRFLLKEDSDEEGELESGQTTVNTEKLKDTMVPEEQKKMTEFFSDL